MKKIMAVMMILMALTIGIQEYRVHQQRQGWKDTLDLVVGYAELATRQAATISRLMSRDCREESEWRTYELGRKSI